MLSETLIEHFYFIVNFIRVKPFCLEIGFLKE